MMSANYEIALFKLSNSTKRVIIHVAIQLNGRQDNPTLMQTGFDTSKMNLSPPSPPHTHAHTSPSHTHRVSQAAVRFKAAVLLPTMFIGSGCHRLIRAIDL